MTDTETPDAALLRDLSRLVHRLLAVPDDRDAALTPLGETVREHLGDDPSGYPVVSEHLAGHRLVDADIALEVIAADDPAAVVLGVAGANRQHDDFSGLLRSAHSRYTADGPVEYTTEATGPATTRQTVALGLRLLRVDGEPIAVLQRSAARQYGREHASVDVIALRPDVATSFLERVRALMVERSVVRGNVVTFARDEYGHGQGRLTFVARPDVPASAVVLPPGLRERVHDHVVGISAHAGELRARGQHLKRGVLLYGPPGTGKTLTVRHLVSEAPDTTVVLLQGGALALVGEATRLARTLTPAIVVLEDVDLVASSRESFGIQPLLFEVLDALDGLDGDADVAFVLTTNRADALEPALAARPGRVDLAVEISLPDDEARRRLFRTYAGALPFSPEALDAAADAAEGVTASFAKELIRRAVLRATQAEREPTDDDLRVALDDLLTSAEGVSRVLFGGAGAADAEPEGDAHAHGASHGWFGSQPPVTYTAGDD